MGQLEHRLRRLEELAPAARRRRDGVTVPTESLAAFVRGLLAGAFALEDIDRDDPRQQELGYGLCVALISLSPGHQAWCDRSGWGRADHDRWERRELGELTADELASLRALAAFVHPDDRAADPLL